MARRNTSGVPPASAKRPSPDDRIDRLRHSMTASSDRSDSRKAKSPSCCFPKGDVAPSCWKPKGRRHEAKKDVQQGTLALMVLKTLDVLGPLHGYGVARRIEQISGDLLAVNQGTLYPLLLKLEQEGAIASEWGASENNRRARFYRLTRDRAQAAPGRDPGLGADRRAHRPVLRGQGGGPAMRALRRFLSRLFASATRPARRRADAGRRSRSTSPCRPPKTSAAGLSPDEARRQAVLKFGAVEAIKEQLPGRAAPAASSTISCRTCAMRCGSCARRRCSPLTATLSLAMGIGANAAVFTVIERVLLRPLPVSDPQELVFVTDERILTQPSPRFSYPFYEGLRDNNILDGVAARFGMAVTAAVNGRAARVSGELVSGNYFASSASVRRLGRLLTPEDDRTPGAHAVTVISDGFWRRTFGSDPAVLGRDVQINHTTFTIVGVAARDFAGTDVGSPTDIWLPMMMQKEVGRDLLTEAGTNWIEIIGRLSSGKSLERAGAELTTYLERRVQAGLAPSPSRRLILVPGDNGNSPVRRELGPALRVLFALTGLALLLACVNVASLLAARSAAREKEVAVRLALGAGRSRLRRQFLTETLVLAALGGTAGLADRAVGSGDCWWLRSRSRLASTPASTCACSSSGSSFPC